jgi:hypothetical protein
MELLQKLLENEILTPETKAELEEAITSQISEAVEAAAEEAKVEVETSVRAELAEQFVADKEALVEALDTKVQQFLESEMAELQDDIQSFRDLEAEYAEKVVNMKKKLTEVAKKDMAQLVNVLNEFLDERLQAEFTELREDITEVKRIKFGQKLFDDVEAMYEEKHFDKDAVSKRAKLAEVELGKTKKALTEAQRNLAKVKRLQKLNEVLSPLAGRGREMMNAILHKTPTDKLETVYEQFVGRVLNRSAVEEGEEKETKVLAEDSNTQSNEEKVVTETVEVNGDSGKEPIFESEEPVEKHLSKEAEARLRDLSGQLG